MAKHRLRAVTEGSLIEGTGHGYLKGAGEWRFKSFPPEILIF